MLGAGCRHIREHMVQSIGAPCRRLSDQRWVQFAPYVTQTHRRQSLKRLAFNAVQFAVRSAGPFSDVSFYRLAPCDDCFVFPFDTRSVEISCDNNWAFVICCSAKVCRLSEKLFRGLVYKNLMINWNLHLRLRPVDMSEFVVHFPEPPRLE